MRKFVRPCQRERAIGSNRRNRVRALVNSTALVAVSTLFAPAMPAQAVDWTGANSTNWFLDTNWSTNVVPVGVAVTLDTVNPNPTVIGAGQAAASTVTLVGNAATGQLTIQGGGTLSSTASVVGVLLGSQGTVTVTGVGSAWSNTIFIVGSVGGAGTLTIENGGHVSSTGASTIGRLSGAQGTVTVTGVGSTWDASGGLIVGDQGIGTLTVSAGASVTSANLSVGGVGGTGTFTIAGGGAVSNLMGLIGVDAGSRGTVTVTGAGSTWTSSSFVFVGDLGGTGTLTIGDGATVSAGGAMVVAGGAGSTGTLNIGAAPGSAPVAPGTLSTPSVQFGPGTGTLNFNHTATNYVFAPAISGTGSVNVLSGTTILTGTNTYSGGTTINGGTLAVGADNNLGDPSGGLGFGGGTLQFLSGFTSNRAVTLNTGGGSFDTNGNSATLGGTISGTGGLTKVGAGTLTLSGSSTYTGATMVNAGTLQAGATNAFAAGGAFTVASGATLNLASFNQTIGSLAGAGSVTLGSATLTTGNDNTSTTFSGTISGTGGLSKIGAGVLTLSGVNTYSGGTTLAGGTLSLGNSQALGSGALTTTGSVVDYANGVTIANAIVINSNSTQLQVTTGTATQAGAISELNGPRPLEKIGAGALILAAANTYTGPTTVSAGTLVVNGSIANSAVTVNSGAMLAGAGTVGATTIRSGGIFAPGPVGTPGSMTVAGNLAFQSGALYLVQVTPSSASIANVTGAASLAGTVAASFSSGNFARSNRILSAAGGLGGTTFSALTTSNLPTNFSASLSYTPTDVVLNLNAVLGQGAGLSQNQQNVAGALNNFFNNGGTLPPGFVTVFGLTGANLGNALSQLSGEAATGAQQAGFQMESQFLNLMLDPFVDGRSGIAGTGAPGPALGFAPERDEALPDGITLAYSKAFKEPAAKAPVYAPRWSAWGGAYGGGNRTSGDPAVIGSHDLSANTAGFAGGLDYRLTPNSVVGLALAGGGTNWSLAQGLGGGKSDAFQAGIYGATRSGPAYLAAAFAFANHWMSTDRFAFAGDHLTASFNAQSYGGRVESGYRFATFYGGVTPYAAIQAQSFHTPGYSETDTNGGGFGLAYNSRTGSDTRSELGTRFDRVLALYTNAVLSLRARVAWAHDWVTDPTLAAVFQTLPGASFVVNGATPAKNSALASAGTELRLANGVTLLAKFDGEFASHSSTYAGTGTIRYTW